VQPTTTVELFFDLVYVLAVTQLSHQILDDLTVAGVTRATFLLWIPALALELAAPAAGYWLPRRGRASTADYDIEGGHFAERCQLFVMIALGERPRSAPTRRAEPRHAPHGVGLAMMLGGPALFLVGESLFNRRMTGTTHLPRLAVAGCLVTAGGGKSRERSGAGHAEALG
jgi:low temperature requirement protein LtrA